MTLDSFKAIFWWEWTHRLLGRLLGVVFLRAFVWFAWTGAIARRNGAHGLLFALAGFKASSAGGWWKADWRRASPSPNTASRSSRRRDHLLGAILWTALEYLRLPRPREAGRGSG